MPRLHRSVQLASVFGLSLFGLVACRTPTSILPIDEIERQSEDTERTGEARDRLDPLPVKTPTDILPAEVPLLAEATDPAAVLASVRNLDKFPDFQAFRSEVASEIGIDPFDAEAWQRIGLDRHGAVGIALLDISAEAGVLYGTLVDAKAFGNFLEDLAARSGKGERLTSTEVGNAMVYRFGESLSVVLREGVAMVVFVEDPDHAPRDYVATIATIDPRDALSHSKTFTWAHAQLEAADDGLLFVDPGQLVTQFERESSNSDSDWGVRYAQDELERARRAGEPAERIAELERRVEEERAWQRQREISEAGERELLQSVFGPIEGLIVGGELRSDAITAHARMLIPGDSLLARVFVPADRESPLLRALDRPPLLALDGRADMQALLSLIDLAARAEGEPLQDINADIRNELGIDVLADVYPLLTGNGGVMLTQLREPSIKTIYDAEKHFGLAAYVEVTDPERLRKLIDGLVRSKRVPELGRAKRGDGWSLSVPDWHDVNLSLVGNHLVASTDTKLADRIRDARPGSQAEALADPTHPLRGSIPTPALRLYQRFLWLVVTDVYEPTKRDPESMLYDLDTHSRLTPEQAAAVPRSREFKRKYAEFERLLAELDAFDRRQTELRYQDELQVARSCGDVGMQVERLSDGLGARAVWRMAPGTSPLEVWLGAVLRSGDGVDWAEYERLNQEVSRVREELNTIRQADLEAAAAKQQPK